MENKEEFILKCFKCGIILPEKDIHESHDVPTYLWEGNRQGRKNNADKWGRHYLYKNCHDKYENYLRLELRNRAKEVSIEYFKEEK